MQVEFRWLDTIATSPIMLVIIASSIVTFALVMERTFYFWKRRGTPQHTLHVALTKVRSGDDKAAIWACEQTLHPVGPVAAAIIAESQLPNDEAEERLHVALTEERLKLERNLGVIGTVGSISPLVGLLGTVWGIMRAFEDMAATGSAGPSVVAAGVAEALLTTGASLVLAVPCVALFNHFQRRTHVMLVEAENGARTIRTALLQRGSRFADSPVLDRAA